VVTKQRDALCKWLATALAQVLIEARLTTADRRDVVALGNGTRGGEPAHPSDSSLKMDAQRTVCPVRALWVTGRSGSARNSVQSAADGENRRLSASTSRAWWAVAATVTQ
jgi:hypothetical protein